MLGTQDVERAAPANTRGEVNVKAGGFHFGAADVHDDV